jgi:hypothetical protein
MIILFHKTPSQSRNSYEYQNMANEFYLYVCMTHEFRLIQVMKSLGEMCQLQSLNMKVKSTGKIYLSLIKMRFCETI